AAIDVGVTVPVHVALAREDATELYVGKNETETGDPLDERRDVALEKDVDERRVIFIHIRAEILRVPVLLLPRETRLEIACSELRRRRVQARESGAGLEPAPQIPVEVVGLRLVGGRGWPLPRRRDDPPKELHRRVQYRIAEAREKHSRRPGRPHRPALTVPPAPAS